MTRLRNKGLGSIPRGQHNVQNSPETGRCLMILILIYLLTAFGSTPGGSITVRVYIQTIHRTTQLTLRLLMSYVYGAPSKARSANVV